MAVPGVRPAPAAGPSRHMPAVAKRGHGRRSRACHGSSCRGPPRRGTGRQDGNVREVRAAAQLSCNAVGAALGHRRWSAEPGLNRSGWPDVPTITSPMTRRHKRVSGGPALVRLRSRRWPGCSLRDWRCNPHCGSAFLRVYRERWRRRARHNDWRKRYRNLERLST
jgi:hypothetical protein